MGSGLIVYKSNMSEIYVSQSGRYYWCSGLKQEGLEEKD